MTDTRTHIMMVSLKLFLQKNFKEVTMKEIVDRTGLSKGAFYHYFESKEKLFYELIEYFFSAIMNFDFNSLPDDSLQNFYREYAEQTNSLRFEFLVNEDGKTEDFIDLNFFALLFDAFRLFPEFRTQMEIYHEKEREKWISVIKTAKEKKEIQTPLTDEQVAQIFLFTADGLTMNLTMESNTSDLSNKLASLWDNFYATLKN